MKRVLYAAMFTPLTIALIIVYAMALQDPFEGSSSRAATLESANGEETPAYFMKADLDPEGPRYSGAGYDITPLPREQVEELASELDEEAYRITQRAGTEPAGCGRLLENDRTGTYCCVVCGLPLFSSEDKFKSGSGWPSFNQPFDPMHVLGTPDHSHGMQRTETVCARCDAHLGHVFRDGPEPTGLQFCINSAALEFYEDGEDRPAESRPVEAEIAYFAGGCFWGIEHYFEKGPGVLDATSGYMQGDLDEPAYKDVLTGETGHAETVKVVYDPSRITYARLLEAFFDMHDPTQVDRQGPDVGPQYRSGIWCATEAQREQAEAFIRNLVESGDYAEDEIATEVEEAKTFWPAEAYHQDYIERTGRACRVSNPW